MTASNELMRCTDALAAAVSDLLPNDHDPARLTAFRLALGDLLAATLGGATTMAAGAVVAIDTKVERLSKARIKQLHDIQADLDRVSSRVHALQDEFLDSGTIGQLANSLAAMALEVEALKARQFGG